MGTRTALGDLWSVSRSPRLIYIIVFPFISGPAKNENKSNELFNILESYNLVGLKDPSSFQMSQSWKYCVINYGFLKYVVWWHWFFNSFMNTFTILNCIIICYSSDICIYLHLLKNNINREFCEHKIVMQTVGYNAHYNFTLNE